MNHPTPRPEADLTARRLRLSGLMDGVADRADAESGVALWRDDPQARTQWHAWHLIGDVMRSEDLASAPARDEAFLARLRERLAGEPVPLAPAPLAGVADNAAPGMAMHDPARRRGLWLGSAAVAAGFVAVAGALVVLRSAEPDAGDAAATFSWTLPLPGGGLQRVGSVQSPSAAPQLDGQVVREVQLDTYLRAHRQVLAGAPALVPGGALRIAEPASAAR